MAKGMAADPVVTCAECGAVVTSVSSETQAEWVLRDEYKHLTGAPGVPVGYPYGRQVPVKTTTTLEPCGHVILSAP